MHTNGHELRALEGTLQGAQEELGFTYEQLGARWHSPALGREMELLVFGHGGARMLVFPTSQGRFFEWEDRGWSTRSASTSRAAGSSSTAWTAWTRRAGTRAGSTRRPRLAEPAVRALPPPRGAPLHRHRNPNPFLITTGASFGAYHAVNLASGTRTAFTG
jgi:hypothetical protein